MKKYIFNCEGVLWKEQSFYNESRKSFTHNKYKTFWCRGRTCAKKNDEVNLDLPFEAWTINEIGKVFGFTPNLDISTFFAGWVNRRNELLERLECRECHKALKPEPFGDFASIPWYAIPFFKCINEQCSEYENKIRITHCCNGNCHGDNLTIIDSRDSPKCSDNWLVCQDCYACCKTHHDMKEACCYECGKKLVSKTVELQRKVWECTCGKIVQDEQMKLLEKFWNKPMDLLKRKRFIEEGLIC